MNKSPIDQFNESVPLPLLIVLRGIGQVFFQENAVSGLLFVVGIALSSPLMAIGALIGSAIGSGVAWVMKWDRGELEGGIFGFNATLVGIASFFFFQPGLVMFGLMIAGCVVATLLTRFMRVGLPFPTYTTPFIVTTWLLFYLGNSMGAVANPGGAPLVPNIATGYYVESATHGIGQVMFQSSLWTGLFFLAGLAISDRKHALLVFVGSIVGLLVSKYHFTFGGDAVDPERLVERSGYDLIQLGLYGYNATLAPVALYLAKRSWIPAVLGMFLTVPLTDLVPLFGLPALTAPFVLATWLVLAVSYVESKFKNSLPDR
jgi:urea transporter